MASGGWARASPGGVGGWDPSLETVDYPHPAPAVSTRSRTQMKRLHPSPLHLGHQGSRAGWGRSLEPGAPNRAGGLCDPRQQPSAAHELPHIFPLNQPHI